MRTIEKRIAKLETVIGRSSDYEDDANARPCAVHAEEFFDLLTSGHETPPTPEERREAIESITKDFEKSRAHWKTMSPEARAKAVWAADSILQEAYKKNEPASTSGVSE